MIQVDPINRYDSVKKNFYRKGSNFLVTCLLPYDPINYVGLIVAARCRIFRDALALSTINAMVSFKILQPSAQIFSRSE